MREKVTITFCLFTFLFIFLSLVEKGFDIFFYSGAETQKQNCKKKKKNSKPKLRTKKNHKKGFYSLAETGFQSIS